MKKNLLNSLVVILIAISFSFSVNANVNTSNNHAVVATYAEFEAIGAGNVALFDGELYISYVNGKDIYAVDQDGEAIHLYDAQGILSNELGYVAGATIPAGFQVLSTLVNGNVVAVPVAGFGASIAQGSVSPIDVFVSNINKESRGKLVHVKKVVIKAITSEGFVVMDADGNELKVNNRFNANVFGIKTGAVCDITGIVECNGDDIAVALTDFAANGTTSLEDEWDIDEIIITGGDEITVEGAEIVEVYTTDGRIAKPRVKSIKGAGEDANQVSRVIEVESGIYVVVADKVAKVVVVQ